jgi:glycosyltransferase involved in cell wall biosynthesis
MRPAGAHTTVGLAMIVKNEARTLPRLAASLDGQLDHWTIVDTGSTDDTTQVAEEVFNGVEGEVIHDEWRGYGPSRNVALTHARDASEWILTLDADETFHGEMDHDIPTDFDGVEAECHFDPLRYWVPRLVRAEAAWEWRGRAHEYLTLPESPGRLFRTTSFHVEHHADGGNRGDKLARELSLLRADHRDIPEDPRTVFYLARTYEDGQELARAATWYRKRVELAGWPEETWYATWRLGCCLLGSGRADEGCGVLWSAWGARPWRAEPLWTLAEHYRLTNQWQLSFEACELARRHCAIGAEDATAEVGGDRSFVHADVYRWRIDYEQSICSYYVGQRDLGLALIAELLARTDLPATYVSSLQENRRFYER